MSMTWATALQNTTVLNMREIFALSTTAELTLNTAIIQEIWKLAPTTMTIKVKKSTTLRWVRRLQGLILTPTVSPLDMLLMANSMKKVLIAPLI